MPDSTFKAHKPARELPISKTTSDLLKAVDKQLKNPLKVYLQPISHGMAFIGFYIKDGRIYTGNRTISHLYDLIRLQRDAEDKAFHVERFARRYNSLVGFLVHTIYAAAPGTL